MAHNGVGSQESALSPVIDDTQYGWSGVAVSDAEATLVADLLVEADKLDEWNRNREHGYSAIIHGTVVSDTEMTNRWFRFNANRTRARKHSADCGCKWCRLNAKTVDA